MPDRYARRGLPSEEEGWDHPAPALPHTGARRALPDTAASSPQSPRRAAAAVEEAPRDGDRRTWLIAAILPLLLAAAIAVVWLTVGPRDSGLTTAVPSETSSTPTSGDSGQPEPIATAPLPSGSALASPAGRPSAPGDDVSGSPSVPATTQLDLNGILFDMAAGWELYTDELVQDERRLVRMSEPNTDVRIQAVSLTSVSGPLDEACLDLMAEHRSLYTAVAEGLPVEVAINGEGEGVSCNFTGTRASDSVPTTVEFTLLQLDGVTLTFRDTVPSAVPEDSPALSELIAMECQAAASFGVAVDQCSLTPGPGGG